MDIMVTGAVMTVMDILKGIAITDVMTGTTVMMTGTVTTGVTATGGTGTGNSR